MGRLAGCLIGASLVFATPALAQQELGSGLGFGPTQNPPPSTGPQPTPGPAQGPGTGPTQGPGPGPAQGLGPGPAQGLGPGQGDDLGPPPDVLVQGGFPPTIGVVEGVQDGKIILRHLQVKPTQETHKVPVTKKVNVDGREVEQTEYVDQTFTRLRPSSSPFACDLADVMAFDTNGQPIPPEVLVTMFPRARMVLMTFPGFPVDPLYLKLARDGTPFLAFLALPPPPQNMGQPSSPTSTNPAGPGGAPPSTSPTTTTTPSQPLSQPPFQSQPPSQPPSPTTSPSQSPSQPPAQPSEPATRPSSEPPTQPAEPAKPSSETPTPPTPGEPKSER